MAKYYDNTNVCEHQRSSLVNLLTEDHILDDDSRTTHPLLANADDPPTFCMRCRSLSNASSILQFEAELNTAATDWTSNLRQDCNGHVSFNNGYYPGQQQPAISYSDGADIPLLTNGDGFSTVTINSLHVADDDMDHCHSLSSPSPNLAAWKKLVAATIMCLIFMVSEIVGGYLAGSLAVMTDAAHLLSDLVGFIVSLFAIWMRRRPANRTFSFGYHRAEVLGALLSVVLIWMLTGVFVYLAILRLVHREYHINADTMMIVAAVGIIINIVMGLVLHGMCHGVQHHHAHLLTQSPGSFPMSPRNHRNINIRAAVIHVVGDLIQSIGVFVSSIVIKFYPNAKMADPICTFLFSLLVLITTGAILRDTMYVLMEGFPRHLDYATLAAQLHAIDGVRNVHELHVWSLTTSWNAIAVHLAVDSSVNPDIVLKRAQRMLRRKYDIHSTTIQIEKYRAEAMQDCNQCKALAV